LSKKRLRLLYSHLFPFLASLNFLPRRPPYVNFSGGAIPSVFLLLIDGDCFASVSMSRLFRFLSAARLI
jgi:hypothetical protein